MDNKEKLVRYLSHFHADKDDEQFREEKGLLINTLTRLEYAPPASEGTSRRIGLLPAARFGSARLTPVVVLILFESTSRRRK